MGREAPLGVNFSGKKTVFGQPVNSRKIEIPKMKFLQSSERSFHMSSENCAKGKGLFQKF